MKKGTEAGFTLVELLITALLFSFVIAGLAAIYATAFQQSSRLFGDSKIKTGAVIALRAIQQEMARSTRIEAPNKNSSGSVLAACYNFAVDGTHVESTEPYGSFAFCVKSSAGGSCQGSVTPPCMYYYQFSNSCASPSVVTTSNCGNSVGGSVPVLLVSDIQTSIDPQVSNYFTRAPGQGVYEDNVVRVAFRVNGDPGGSRSRPLFYDVDTALSAQIAVTP